MLFSAAMRVVALTVICFVWGIPDAAASGYVQTNLTSDIPGLAANTDPNLKNPWGMSFGPNTPFWVSDQVTGVATLYNGSGVPQQLVVTTPPTPGPGPTDQVFLNGLGFTMSGGGGTALFAFATLAGTIDAFNGGTAAIIQASRSGAVDTGLAVGGGMLYAANTAQGRIDVFDNSFQPTTVSGSFIAPNLPAGFTPYNIQTVNGKLYVEYAKQFSPIPGGFIGVFDLNGNLLQQIGDAHLNSPWGITLAPATFGQFGGDLLVGNFGDGMINAFNPVSGAFLGTLTDATGNPIVNSGLWSLQCRDPGSSFDANALFFTAGINGQTDGLFGEISVAPEPGTLAMLTVAAFALGFHHLARRTRLTAMRERRR